MRGNLDSISSLDYQHKKLFYTKQYVLYEYMIVNLYLRRNVIT